MSASGQITPIEADRIRTLIPHAGKMCLLERVVAWDAASIRCETRSHLDPGNPLRRNGRLSSIHGIEYAAQAMALHGALRADIAAPSATPGAHAADDTTAAAAPRHGYLASVRDTRCSGHDLDHCNAPLVVAAELVVAESSRVIYSFSVSAAGTVVVSGRAAVVLA